MVGSASARFWPPGRRRRPDRRPLQGPLMDEGGGAAVGRAMTISGAGDAGRTPERGPGSTGLAHSVKADAGIAVADRPSTRP